MKTQSARLRDMGETSSKLLLALSWVLVFGLVCFLVVGCFVIVGCLFSSLAFLKSCCWAFACYSLNQQQATLG